MSLVSRLISICAVSVIAVGTLTGCGIGAADTTQPIIATPAISGQVMGGIAPIVGATVKIYTTGVTPGDGTSTNTGYGVGTLMQEATQVGASAGQDTGTLGGYTFAGGYNCPAGQFAYIVASGGNPGGTQISANPNSVLVAALGRCEDLYTLTSGKYTGYKGSGIVIDELTTVAAAYALGQFSSETGSGAATKVLIGADSGNNAVSGSATTSSVAGLAHAFQNAINLVTPFGITEPSANTTLPGNANAAVPQALIHAIGNTIVACVNSTGGTAGDSSACGKIFTATTIGTSVPVDTWGALVNLAANPTLGGSGTAVTNFLGYATAQTSVYLPTVTTAHDLSIAINYSAANGFTDTQSGALDINDVYYVGNTNLTNSNVVSFSSNGTLLGASALAATAMKGAYNITMDALGNGYFADGGNSGSTAIAFFTTSGGVASTPTTTGVDSPDPATHTGLLKVYALAVDRSNNLWALGVSNSANAVSNLYMSASGITAGGSTFYPQVSPTVTVPSSPGYIGLSIDPGQNVWTAASNVVNVIPNNVVTNSSNLTNYTGSPLVATAPTGNPAVGITFTGTSSAYTAWVGSYGSTTAAGIQSYVPTLSGTAVTAAGTYSFNNNTTFGGTIFAEADGAGTVWAADKNSSSVMQYSPTATTAYRLQPCMIVASACASVFTTLGPYDLSIDSAGSIWAVDYTGGTAVEIIGSAAPTWPLLSLGKLGKP